MTLLRLASWFSFAVCLSGCAAISTPPPTESQRTDDTPPSISNTGDLELDRLNQGYSLLYQAVAGLQRADLAFLIKIERDEVQRSVSAMTDYAGQLAKRLETFPELYPSIRLDLVTLPEMEVRKQKAAQAQRIRSFAPIVGRTGPDFERTLLLTLGGASFQQRYLCKVMAEDERNSERRQLLRDCEQNFERFFLDMERLLNADYYVHKRKVEP